VTASRAAPVAIWVAFLTTCLFVIGRASFTTDLSAFLPRAPTAGQQVLIDQLTEGAVSRMILIGIEGPDPTTRATLSRETAKLLRASGEFALVNNGDSAGGDRDRDILFNHRYVLSPAVSADRFSEAGLRAAISESIDLLASPAGLMLKTLLPRDPTGELVQVLGSQDLGALPSSANGVWVSRDGTRAVLVAQTRASGSDTDGQQHALATIKLALDHALEASGIGTSQVRLLLSGPGVFSVTSRETIREDVKRLSAIGVISIVGLLLIVYRSPLALGLGLLPVITGAVAGVAAVSLGFGIVHGITLGFGTTLIGEAVDYSIYFLVQSSPTKHDSAIDRGDWIATFWPTIRLGMLTSVVGFCTLLFSGFPGLAQLGLYSVSGIVVAAAVTRFVLPPLVPAGFRVRDVSFLGSALTVIMARARALRLGLVAILIVASLVIWSHRDSLWNSELSALSPVPLADQNLDHALRADLGAPDLRYLVVISGADQEAVLRAAESVDVQLEKLVERGTLGGFDTPVRLLPSLATQLARQQALPNAAELTARLQEATRDLPIRPERLRPFLADVAAAKNARPLERADLQGSTLAVALDALLVHRDGHWSVLLPLKAAPGAGDSAIDPRSIRAALAESGQQNVSLIDLKSETDRLYAGYLSEAIYLSLAGFVVIVGLLLLVLRSLARVLRVVAPLVAAVVIVIAVHAVCGTRLNILHLVGMLLIAAVGSNYALFFDKRVAPHSTERLKMLASLVLASSTTVIGFGVLAFSRVPVLQAIGATVGPGAILALLFSAILADDSPKSVGKSS
jgi:predicted exporter